MPATSPTATKTAPAPDDETVIAEVVRGNREMFEVLVRRYNQQLYRVGMAYLRCHEQTEDAMQNAYLKAYLNLKKFQGGARFSTWLTRIMINECLMHLRWRRSPRGLMETDVREPDLAIAMDNEELAPRRAVLGEMKALLEKTVADLPEPYRVVYVLREVHQMDTRDTAESLGISVESVKVRLHRAREALKTRLLASAEGAELFPYPARYCNALTARVMALVLDAP